MRGLRRAPSGKASEETVNNILKRKRIFQFTEFFNRMQTKLGLTGSLAFGAVPAEEFKIEKRQVKKQVKR